MNPFKDPEILKILFKIAIFNEKLSPQEEEEFKNLLYKKVVNFARETHDNLMKENESFEN